MNHRDVMALAVTAAGNPFYSTFMELPQELQDEIIDKIDTGEATFAEAGKMVKEAGHQCSTMAIHRYYTLFCMQRQVFDIRNIVVGLMDQYVQLDPRAATIALYNIVVTNVLKALADGTMKFKSKSDPSKLIDALLRSGNVLDKLTPDAPGPGSSTADADLRRQRLRELYGLVDVNAGAG